jgi:hypothetical protein
VGSPYGPSLMSSLGQGNKKEGGEVREGGGRDCHKQRDRGWRGAIGIVALPFQLESIHITTLLMRVSVGTYLLLLGIEAKYLFLVMFIFKAILTYCRLLRRRAEVRAPPVTRTTQVPIYQASSDYRSGRPSARCWGGDCLSGSLIVCLVV